MKIVLRDALLGMTVLCLSAMAHAGPAAEAVLVQGAYARAVPPGQPNGAAFMTLSNSATGDHALVAARSPAAKVIELHSHSMEGGMMRMRPVERIEVPAGATVTLQPGGLHLMFIGLGHQLMPGEAVQITLVYEDGSESTLEVPVRKVQAAMHQGHDMEHKH